MRTVIGIALFAVTLSGRAEDRPIGLTQSELGAIRTGCEYPIKPETAPAFSDAARRLLTESRFHQVVARPSEGWLYREADYLLVKESNVKADDYQLLTRFLGSKTYKFYRPWMLVGTVDPLRSPPHLVAGVLDRERRAVAQSDLSDADKRRFTRRVGEVLADLPDKTFGEVVSASADGGALRQARDEYRKDEDSKVTIIFTGSPAMAGDKQLKYAVQTLGSIDHAWAGPELPTYTHYVGWTVRGLDKDLAVVEYGAGEKLYVKGSTVRDMLGKKRGSLSALMADFTKADDTQVFIESFGSELRKVDKAGLSAAIRPR